MSTTIVKRAEAVPKNPAATITCSRCGSQFNTDQYTVVGYHASLRYTHLKVAIVCPVCAWRCEDDVPMSEAEMATLNEDAQIFNGNKTL